jgi:tetratricopeptide (TPR) repeat protein
MCGGDLQATDNTYGTCTFCGSTMTLPKANDERVVNLFNRANHQRQQCDFDKAFVNYENILNEDSTNAEAHWGMVLCRYGIGYVEDPRTRERIPTCYRIQYEPILSDGDYLAALENAMDNYTRELYESEAKKINEIQKKIITILNNEEPYDVFICYKETSDSGSRTKDSTLAQEIYYQLEKEGYKVFFARITLEGKLGQDYESYIRAALEKARLMLVIGTKKEYFEAVWVRNEWSRFLLLKKEDSSKQIFPCYRDMDAYDIPDELSMYQSQDMSKIGFMQDLIHGVKKVLNAGKVVENPTVQSTNAISMATAPGVESLLTRGHIFLEDSNWQQADEYFEKALDIDPKYAPAYIGKLCVELKIKTEEDLANNKNPLESMPNYTKALRFSNGNYRMKIEQYNSVINQRIEKEKQEHNEMIYKIWIGAKREADNDLASTAEYYQGIATNFQKISLYKDSDELAKQCIRKAENIKKEKQIKEQERISQLVMEKQGQGLLFLKDSNWVQADECFKEVLKLDSKYAPAYIGKLCVALKINSDVKLNELDVSGVLSTDEFNIPEKHLSKEIINHAKDGNLGEASKLLRRTTPISKEEANKIVRHIFDNNSLHIPSSLNEYKNFKLAFEYADEEYLSKLKEYEKVYQERVIKEKNERQYQVLIHEKDNFSNLNSNHLSLIVLAEKFREMNNYKESNALAEECERMVHDYKKREQQRKEEQQKLHEEQRKRKQEEQLRQQQEELRQREQRRQWEQQGLCRYCGGQYGGVFTKKCKSCGKSK